jgi:hypothetical protein
VFTAGTVILSLGFKPDNRLYDVLKDKYPNVINTGDSNNVGDVLDVCLNAYEICKDI